MAKIGSLHADGLKQTDELEGEIRTLKFQHKFVLVPVKQKLGDKAPDYEIFTEGAESARVQIGLAWKSISKKTGKEYISIRLDDPSFAREFQCAAFISSDGCWDISWKRE